MNRHNKQYSWGIRYIMAMIVIAVWTVSICLKQEELIAHDNIIVMALQK